MSTKFFKTFRNEFVSILTRTQIEHTVSTENSIESMKTPLNIKGFLLDIDDEYYYLGMTQEFINQTVKIDEVIHIEIVPEEADLMEQLLVDGEIPSEEKFN